MIVKMKMFAKFQQQYIGYINYKQYNVKYTNKKRENINHIDDLNILNV